MNIPILKNLSEAIRFIKTIGFTADLTVDQNCLYCTNEDVLFAPNEFTVQQHIKVPSEDPNMPIHLLALASNYQNLKGFMVSHEGTFPAHLFAKNGF